MKKMGAFVLLLMLLLPACALAAKPNLTDKDGVSVEVSVRDEDKCFEYTLPSGSYTLSRNVENGWGLLIWVEGDVALTLSDVSIASGQAMQFLGEGSVTLELEGQNDLTSDTRLSDNGNTALYSKVPVIIADQDNDGSLTLIVKANGDNSGNCAYFEEDLTLLTRNIQFNPLGGGSAALTVSGKLTCGEGFGIRAKDDLHSEWATYNGDGSASYAEVADVIRITYEGIPYEADGLAGAVHWVESWYGECPEGKVFSHWLTQDGEKLKEGEPIYPVKNMTLTPVFEDAVEIVWYDNGMEVMNYRCVRGSEVESPRGHHSEEGVFTGWKVSDVDVVLQSGQYFIADRDLTFVAQYEPQQMVEIQLLEGADGGYSGQSIYLPKGKPWKVNYAGWNGEGMKTFIGWRTESGDLLRVGETFTPMKDTELWAEYKDIQETVTLYLHDTDEGATWDEERTIGGYISPAEFRDWHMDQRKTLSKMMLDGVTYGPQDYILVTRDMEGKTLTLYYEKLVPVRIPQPGVNLPQTGDTSRLALWLALTGIAGMGMLMLRRRAHN